MFCLPKTAWPPTCAAFANGSTDACAGCHRIHSAKSADGFLLVATDVYALCTSCHDGTGAYTNVVDGYYTKTAWNTTDHGAAPAVTQGDQDLGLFGGGFVAARIPHNWNGRNAYTDNGLPAGETTTDAHEVGQGLFAATGTLWGSGDVNTVSRTETLECTSCHDPHGNAGRTGGVATGAPVPSYRILRYAPEGSNGFETTGPSAAYFANYVSGGTTYAYVGTGAAGGVYVVDPAVKWYTPNNYVVAGDPTVAAYRTRWDGAAYSPWTAIVSGPGDLTGRSYIYMRPAVSAYTSTSGGMISGMFSCVDATGNLPTLPAAQLATATAGVNYYTCGANTGTTFNNVNQRASLGLWCSTCHDRYLATGARQTNSGDSYYMYRHTSTGSVPCVDCHTAHGSTSQVYAANGTNYSAAATINAAHPSNMLKQDNRGICVRCHGTSVNFQYSSSPIVGP